MSPVAKSLAVFSLSLALIAGIAMGIAVPSYGADAYASCGLAALLVWLVGCVGIALVGLAPNPRFRLNAALFGMLVRLAIPLTALLVLPRISERLAQAGFVGFILVFYLAGLLIETPLLVLLVRQDEAIKSNGSCGKEIASKSINGATS